MIFELLGLATKRNLSQETLAGLNKLGVAAGITTKLLKNSIKSRRSGIDPGFPVQVLGRFGLKPADLLSTTMWLTGLQLSPIVEEIAELACGNLVDSRINEKALQGYCLYSVSASRP